MDNLSSHESGLTLTLIRHGGAAVLFLPPYLLDFNLIKTTWSKVKNHGRSAEAGTFKASIAAIGLALATGTKASPHKRS